MSKLSCLRTEIRFYPDRWQFNGLSLICVAPFAPISSRWSCYDSCFKYSLWSCQVCLDLVATRVADRILELQASTFLLRLITDPTEKRFSARLPASTWFPPSVTCSQLSPTDAAVEFLTPHCCLSSGLCCAGSDRLLVRGQESELITGCGRQRELGSGVSAVQY